jgi:hypothetical protein
MSTRVLSIDVGIKNLAFCLFEKEIDSTHFSISKWDIINLSQEDEIQKCQCVEKNNICNKPAKYQMNDSYFCLKHSKKQDYHLPSSELKNSFINKQKIQKLIEIADKYNIQYEKPIKKNDLIFKINDYINNKCFKEITTTNSSQIDLITIGRNIKSKFNKYFPIDYKINYIIIENQISPIANRMKTIQGMIAQYFIMNNSSDHIEFVSSINKLKNTATNDGNLVVEESKKESDYKSRKKQGITKCLEFLNNDHRFNSQLIFFNNHKKKDDLSDCFLQGLWYINSKNI